MNQLYTPLGPWYRGFHRNASIGAYKSTYIHVVITVFMILSGISFPFTMGFIREEGGVIQMGAKVIPGNNPYIRYSHGLNLYMGTGVYKNMGLAFDSFFQVGSIITTTVMQPLITTLADLYKMILFFLMFVGGCAGSTSGVLKTFGFWYCLSL